MDLYISYDAAILEYKGYHDLNASFSFFDVVPIHDGLLMLTWLDFTGANASTLKGKLLELSFYFMGEDTDVVLSFSNPEYASFLTRPTGEGITLDTSNTLHGSVKDLSLVWYELTVHLAGEGQVMVDDTPYQDPMTFGHGYEPVLMATPADGWQFDGWSGDIVSTTASIDMFMDKNTTITATFTQKPPSVFKIEFSILTEELKEIHGAVITLNDSIYPEGVLIFPDMLAGDYGYVVSFQGYYDEHGVVTIVDSDVRHTVIMKKDDLYAMQPGHGPLKIFPNPVVEHVMVEAGEPIGKIYITDCLGKTVYEAETHGAFFKQLDLRCLNLNHGMYFISIQTEKARHTERIFISR